jgi:hypothetical protein
MAVTVLSNKKNKSVTLHIANANSGNIVLSGNSTTTNVGSTSTCIAIGDEVLTGAVIDQVFYGMDGNTHAHILRGSSTTAVVNNTGHLNFNAHGISLNVNPTANLVVNFVGDANSFVIIELKKLGHGSSEYFQV